jgi:hypothetical protein
MHHLDELHEQREVNHSWICSHRVDIYLSASLFLLQSTDTYYSY